MNPLEGFKLFESRQKRHGLFCSGMKLRSSGTFLVYLSTVYCLRDGQTMLNGGGWNRVNRRSRTTHHIYTPLTTLRLFARKAQPHPATTVRCQSGFSQQGDCSVLCVYVSTIAPRPGGEGEELLLSYYASTPHVAEDGDRHHRDPWYWVRPS
jgi:hypothetical protein